MDYESSSHQQHTSLPNMLRNEWPTKSSNLESNNCNLLNVSNCEFQTNEDFTKPLIIDTCTADVNHYYSSPPSNVYGNETLMKAQSSPKLSLQQLQRKFNNESLVSHNLNFKVQLLTAIIKILNLAMKSFPLKSVNIFF